MQRKNPYTRDLILSLLKDSTKTKNLASTREAYSRIVKTGFDSVSFYGDHLIRSLASCGSFCEAHHVFSVLPCRTVHTWHAIMSASTKLGDGHSALMFFDHMSSQGISPDKYVVTCYFKACGLVKDLHRAMVMHNVVMTDGHDSSEAVGSALIDMYMMCDRIDEGLRVFETLSCRDVVSWETAISGLVGKSDGLRAIGLFEKMLREGVEPTKVGYFSVFKACRITGSISYGMQIHALLIENKEQMDSKVANTLIDMYTCDVGSLDDAYKVFISVPDRDIVSWCVIIAGYAQHEHGHVALGLFKKMLTVGVNPDKVVFLCVLKACEGLESLRHGQMIHYLIVQFGIVSDVVLINTLADMYAKCGGIIEARRLFDQLPNPTEVSCNAIIGGYARDGDVEQVMEIYKYMKKLGLEPTIATYILMLKAFKSIGGIKQGRTIHAEMIERSLEMDVMVGNTLMDVYSKCGCLPEAFSIFQGMPSHNEISWGIIITGAVENGCDLLALSCFNEMLKEGTQPDKVTFLTILKACGHIGALMQGKHIHGKIVISGIEQDQAINSSLIDMYCKCGGILEASKIFGCLHSRDIASWGMMLSGCALYGSFDLLCKNLRAMQDEGIKMNSEVLTSILSTCSHAGISDVMDHAYFRHIYGNFNDQSNGSVEHYSCVVDSLGRLGYLQEAINLLHTMPIMPNNVSWMGLLSSSNTYGNLGLGNTCFAHDV